MGRPRLHPAWPEKGCLPAFRVREINARNEWILPASHLLVDEDPGHAAKRICRDWAGVRRARPRLIAVDSSPMPMSQWAGSGRTRRPIHHWAVGFVYEVRSDAPAPTAPWWSAMRFIPVAELRRTPIGRSHRDLIRYVTHPAS